ncbi:MAG: thioredoxin-dependent thiol peroxidase [Candidatus Lokiarchaeota archaeon]|nr:thioredoxin-dependent thiol peroxidase [Candidatus Lokiarchaeota archaeon]
MSEQIVELKVGVNAPKFCLLDKDNQEVCLEDFKGKFIVLYFYPKDNTPGCTIEAIGFTGILSKLQKLNAVVVGISPDSPESHAKFIEKNNLKVTLLSDVEKKVIKEYGKWAKKKFRGKEYMGVVRSTFLLNPDGVIVHIWPKVSVKGHPEDVQNILTELRK